jgi:hypothetical protein
MDKEANNTTTVNCHDAMRRRSCSSAFTVACAARSASVRSAPSLETPAMESARSWARRAVHSASSLSPSVERCSSPRRSRPVVRCRSERLRRAQSIRRDRTMTLAPCCRVRIVVWPALVRPVVVAGGRRLLMYHRCINPRCTGLSQRVRTVPTRPRVVPAQRYDSTRSGTSRISPILRSFRFGSRRPGVRISPSRPHRPGVMRRCSATYRSPSRTSALRICYAHG